MTAHPSTHPLTTAWPAPALSRAAAAAFTVRQAKARETVRAGTMELAAAESHLAPWLAIACLAGAELPELAEPLAARVARDAGTGEWLVSEGEARSLIAADICPRQRWVLVLARARDEAAIASDLIHADARSTAAQREAVRADALALDALCRALAVDPGGRFPVPPAHQSRAARPAETAGRASQRSAA